MEYGTICFLVATTKFLANCFVDGNTYFWLWKWERSIVLETHFKNLFGQEKTKKEGNVNGSTFQNNAFTLVIREHEGCKLICKE